MSVRLALYKGRGTAFNAAIRWWTGSIYSHCELVVDGASYSSSLMDGGVRAKIITFDPERWDFIDLPWADSDSIVEYFYQTEKDRYNIAGLLASQVLNRNQAFRHAQFCSEWCANALGVPAASSYSPATLGGLCGWVFGALRLV